MSILSDTALALSAQLRDDFPDEVQSVGHTEGIAEEKIYIYLKVGDHLADMPLEYEGYPVVTRVIGEVVARPAYPEDGE